MLTLSFRPKVRGYSNPKNLFVDYIQNITLSSFELGAYDIEPEQGLQQPTILSFIAVLNNTAGVEIVGYEDLDVVAPSPIVVEWKNFQYEIIIDVSGKTVWGDIELGDASILSVGFIDIRQDDWLHAVQDFMVKMGFVQDGTTGWFPEAKLNRIIFREVLGVEN